MSGEVLTGPYKGKVVKNVRYQLPDGHVVLEEPFIFSRLHAVDETLVLASVEYVVRQSSVDDDGVHQVVMEKTAKDPLYVEVLGDTPDAPCYGLDKDKPPYRAVVHQWKPLGAFIEGCSVCGGIRRQPNVRNS